MTREAKRARTSGALAEGGAFEARPWGGFCILEEGPGYKVKRLVVEPADGLSVRTSHLPLAEVLTVEAQSGTLAWAATLPVPGSTT